MKKILTVLAIMMSVLCSSMVLSACSDGYKKMYLEAECVLPKAGGGDDWRKIENGGTFDYVLEDAMKSKENPNLYVMYLRVNVKGTSKKVDSLYISASETAAVTLSSNTIKPNEAFEVLVSTVGSVTFTITPPPNKGGDEKAISFTINIYRTLTSINQNEECVPALMVGDALNIDNLPNLVEYHPINETNQTGVDYRLAGIGHFNGDGLLDGKFESNGDFAVAGDGMAITHASNVAVRLK